MATEHRWRGPSSSEGFTLVELAVAMAIAGGLMSVGAFGFSTWLDTSRHQGTADQLLSQLRSASTLAVSEGRTYCVEVSNSGRAYSLWRYSCNTTAPTAGQPAHERVLGPRETQHDSVSVDVDVVLPSATALTPAPACPAGSECVYFYPRGTATEGDLAVSSTARPSKTYTIHVEGLTARVYI